MYCTNTASGLSQAVKARIETEPPFRQEVDAPLEEPPWMDTPLTEAFLSGVANAMEQGDGITLRRLLLVEPPLPPLHHLLTRELREWFPRSHYLEYGWERVGDSDDEDAGSSQETFIQDSSDDAGFQKSGNNKSVQLTLNKEEENYLVELAVAMRGNPKGMSREDLRAIKPPLPPLHIEILARLIDLSSPEIRNGHAPDNATREVYDPMDAQNNKVQDVAGLTNGDSNMILDRKAQETYNGVNQGSQDGDAQDKAYRDEQNRQHEDARDSQYEDAENSQDEDDYPEEFEYSENGRYEGAHNGELEGSQDVDYEGDYEDSQDWVAEADEAPLKKICKGFLFGKYEEVIDFIWTYLAFLRDIDYHDLVGMHKMLQKLFNSALLSLQTDGGLVLLPSFISFAGTFIKLVVALDRQPHLSARISNKSLIGKRAVADGSESTAPERLTVIGSAAIIIKEALNTCLSKTSKEPSVIDSNKQPEGPRVVIYVLANLCLKLHFHEKKLRDCDSVFDDIDEQGPPLALFPASQRVTYLYYLGRYLFANSHFFSAQLTLQSAYDQCHSRFLKQRRLILIYLVASNIILGRFPTSKLLQRPEAFGLSEKFLPLCSVLAKGDLKSFRRLLSLDDSNDIGHWFLHRRILAQFKNRCEVIIWRSLARRTFLIAGIEGNTNTQKAPTLDLQHLLTVANYLESETATPAQTNGHIYPKDISQDVPVSPANLLTMRLIEFTVASLCQQELMQGYISHRYRRFAITGAKDGISTLQTGFPNVWKTITEGADPEVPGLVTEETVKLRHVEPVKIGPGTVIHLGGARLVNQRPAEPETSRIGPRTVTHITGANPVTGAPVEPDEQFDPDEMDED